MFDILHILTMVLNYAGVLFAVIYVMINIFPVYVDVVDRSQSVLKFVKIAVSLAIIFAFLSCLLSNTVDISSAIANTCQLYSVIATAWLIVLLVCGLGMLYCILSKKSYSKKTVAALNGMLKIAISAVTISMLLSWLLS